MADGSLPIEDAQTEVKVRVGTPDDIDPMMEIGMMACSENSFVPVEPKMLLRDIWAALNLHHGIVGIIGAPGEPIEGAVLLRVGNVWYNSTALIIEEKAIFVHPDYRSAKGGRAVRLCEFSKKVAGDLGLPLTIGVLSSERVAAKVRMYRRVLGEPSGAYWIYGASTGGHSVGNS